MNLTDILSINEKSIATKNILGADGTATLIKLKKGKVLDQHQSKTNALLILLSGVAIYDEINRTVLLSKTHDFVSIPEQVNHKVTGEEDALLLLIY